MTTTPTRTEEYRLTVKFLNAANGKNTAILRNSRQTGADMGVTLRNFDSIEKAVEIIQAEYEQLGYTVENFTIQHTPTAGYDVHTATGYMTK